MKPITESKQNNSNIIISVSDVPNSVWACFNENASQSQSGASIENSPLWRKLKDLFFLAITILKKKTVSFQMVKEKLKRFSKSCTINKNVPFCIRKVCCIVSDYSLK